MPVKTKNNSLVRLLSALLMVVVVFSTSSSFAYDFQDGIVAIDSTTGKICPDPNGDGIPNNDGLTARFVVCIKEPILVAVRDFLSVFCNYLASFVAAAGSLAVILWGALMVTGKNSAPVRDLGVLAVKLGAVAIFTDNFGGFFPVFLDTMEWMLEAVTSYVAFSPSFGCLPANGSASIGMWQRVDCTLDSLVGGIFSPFNIYLGITGFLVSALFSQSVGLFIGLLGLMVIGQLIWAMARGLYIFISAYIAFALMVCVSPLFIPLILFRATFGYFEKWLRITMGFMLQPVFLFTYLAMMMAAYDVVVYTGTNSLYRSIAGNEVDNPGFKLGDWLLNNGVYANSSQSSQAYNVDPKKVFDGLAMQKIKTGVLGTTKDLAGPEVKLTEQVTDPSEWRENSGLPKNIFMDKLLPLNYFIVDLPVKAIDWKHLSQINGYDANDPTDYWIDLMLAFVMAVLISYIFLLMIDLLPFIGSGVAGDVLSMPAFGTGPFAPPGDNVMANFKSRIMGNMIGGKA
ncbi:MAG: type IV secretion system protein [Alphaproteobacteria bacterium]